MDKVIKRTVIISFLCFCVLIVSGIILPSVISSNTLPVSIIIGIALTTLAFGFITMFMMIRALMQVVKLESDNEIQ